MSKTIKGSLILLFTICILLGIVLGTAGAIVAHHNFQNGTAALPDDKPLENDGFTAQIIAMVIALIIDLCYMGYAITQLISSKKEN